MDNVTLIRVVSGVMALFVFLPLYFLPAFLARKKRHVVAIGVLNLLLGWTLIGWVGALVWALADEEQKPQVSPQTSAVFCSACGKYSQAGSQFCSLCGRPLSAAVLTTSA